MLTNKKWVRFGGALVLAGLLYAVLGPAGWQPRLGNHWLLEHFFVYFGLTVLACVVWPRPLAVAAVLIPVAVLLEAAQALTPDRTADLATALSASSGIAVAALIAKLTLTFWERHNAASAKRP